MPEKIRAWMMNFIEVNHPSFGGLPICPYVKAARLSSQVSIERYCGDLVCQLNLAAVSPIDNVVIYGDHSTLSEDVISDAIDATDRFLSSRDRIALYVFPGDDARVAGVDTAFPDAALVIVQQRSNLMAARRTLATTRYYDGWSKDCLAEVSIED